jgi:hypothetical protein
MPPFWSDEPVNWLEKTTEKILYRNEWITGQSGVAEGRLIGGNVNAMYGFIGSPYFPAIEHGDILLIEDCMKNASVVEKNFAMLKLYGVFEKVVGFKPRITKWDIYYKVYVINNSFYFIKIGGQFHNRHAYDKQLPEIFELLFWFWFKKMEQKQADLEMAYDEQVSCGQVSDLLQKKHNFSINNTDIKEIIINQNGLYIRVFMTTELFHLF